MAPACVSGSFAVWVLTRGELLDYRPALSGHLWLSAAVSATALAVALSAATAGGNAVTWLRRVSAPPT